MEDKRQAETEKSTESRSKVEVMFTVFFDIRGLVNQKFVPEGQMVNKEYYVAV